MNTEKPRERTFPRTEVFAEIDRLGLNANVLELESEGYTVVPSVLDVDTIARTLSTVRRRSVRADPDERSDAGADGVPAGSVIDYFQYDESCKSIGQRTFAAAQRYPGHDAISLGKHCRQL